MNTWILMLIVFFLTAEFWARFLTYIVQLIKPIWFNPEFNVWKHPVPGGWIHKLFK